MYNRYNHHKHNKTLKEFLHEVIVMREIQITVSKNQQILAVKTLILE